MNAYIFIKKHGVEKARRIINNTVCKAEYYSDDTGSYYANPKDHAVSLKKLKSAISEFEHLELLRRGYLAELNAWNKKLIEAS